MIGLVIFVLILPVQVFAAGGRFLFGKQPDRR